MPPSQLLSTGNLHLNCFPFGRLNNSRVAALYIVLGDFTLVDLHGFCAEIHGVGLLQERRSLIFSLVRMLLTVCDCHFVLPPGVGMLSDSSSLQI